MRITRALQIGLIASTAALAVLAAPAARAGAPEPTYFLGDVNCDERVDSIDAALLLQAEAALLEELSCGGNADMDGDGSTNSVDAGLVLQYTAGLILSRVQFSLNVTRPAGHCNDVEKPTVCNVPAGTEFGLSIALNHPPPQGYVAFQSQLIYDDLTYNQTTYADEEVVWPDSALPVRTTNSPYVEDVAGHGALGRVGAPPRVSRHRGDLVRLSMSCSSQPESFNLLLVTFDAVTSPLGSAINLPAEPPNVAIASTVRVGTSVLHVDGDAEQEVEVGIAARLRINCVE